MPGASSGAHKSGSSDGCVPPTRERRCRPKPRISPAGPFSHPAPASGCRSPCFSSWPPPITTRSSAASAAEAAHVPLRHRTSSTMLRAGGPMNTILRSALAVLLTGAAVATPVSALDYPLSSEAIREAYFLGSGDPDKLAFFMEKYTKRYPIPKLPSRGYVALIQFETPYLLVAEHVSQN